MDFYRHILMVDVEGEKVMVGVANTAKKYLLGTEKRETIKILRGELVKPIAPQVKFDGKPPHNYCLQRDHNTTFYSIEDGVSPLAYSDYKLLEAIESVGDRFATFAGVNKLDWGAKLKEGDEVYVRFFSPRSDPVSAEWSLAKVEYKGAVESLPGTTFGVAIMDGRYHGRGSTNGLFQDKYYFQCEDNCGLFVSLDKLAPQPPQGSDRGQSQTSQQGKGKAASEERAERFGQPGNIPGDVKVLRKQLSQETKEKESLQQQLILKNERYNQLQSDNTRLHRQNTELKEQLTRQRTESQQQMMQERAVAAEEKERMINSHSQAEQQFRLRIQQMETRLQELQQEIDSLKVERPEVRYTQLQVPPQDQNSWNVPRDQVEIIGEIGRGGWGIVLKGLFRGQSVAVKKAFQEILDQPYTIRLMKREIQIMASVQHPNLVRFIAAVIDDKVDRGKETPLLIVEMMDVDLRHAYKTSDLGTNKIPIFRDVAYALHYLHEHQEPIIHRDVSAPNVLLQCLKGGTYRAKLSDFGSANKVKDSRTAGAGAICYTAPEAFPPVDLQAPLPPQTPKVDVYSYGILLAEVITKTMPTTENRRQLLHEVKGRWTLMYDLICSCTKPSPSNRPTMASILNTLNRIPTPRPRKV